MRTPFRFEAGCLWGLAGFFVPRSIEWATGEPLTFSVSPQERSRAPNRVIVPAVMQGTAIGAPRFF